LTLVVPLEALLNQIDNNLKSQDGSFINERGSCPQNHLVNVASTTCVSIANRKKPNHEFFGPHPANVHHPTHLSLLLRSKTDGTIHSHRLVSDVNLTVQLGFHLLAGKPRHSEHSASVMAV